MAYLIEKEVYNGYRCCCMQSWECREDWVDTRDEAFTQVPRDMPTQNKDGGLYRVTVTDGETGEEIAEVQLSWLQGYGSLYSQMGSRWSGYIGDEKVESIVTKTAHKTWSEFIEYVKNDQLKKEKKKLSENIKRDQERLIQLQEVEGSPHKAKE